MPMGAPVHNLLSGELASRFPSFQFMKTLYGMTETMLISAWNDPTALGHLEPGMGTLKNNRFSRCCTAWGSSIGVS